ncbi:Nmad2 family putative nucleotide modification protein [Fibrella forsythiae]|uniref:Nucleotide modification associated domain-containing protein n=1 Tax=Fibrella forsythiae TaxID=2817061 RepID=A0ABS3JSU0_9BACT|nr:hypothetical protein [Fibrella forsythiae]MBO0953079.1 hypothetical protein [Fibrella forsythiae]
MECFSYIITRDHGFAPNPFHGYCTLATCKPMIREKAKIGDWIVGFASRSFEERKIIYIMNVSEKINFEDYWHDIRFQIKKPNMKASVVKAYGDNIYYKDLEINKWIQVDSHHSYDEGIVNPINYENDTKSEFVLISDNFYYFGKKPIIVPPEINIEKLIIKRGNTRVKDEMQFMPLIEWIRSRWRQNYIYNDPAKFDKVVRYSGK